MNDIKEFLGPHRWLSNFWPAPVVMDGDAYPTVEHAYQAAKTLDPGERKGIRDTASPGAAKRLGGFVTKRDDWDTIKLEVMRRLLLQKFAIPELRQKLLDTGDARIIEGNTWGDTFWGVCRGNGTNHLGRLIEDIREQANAEAI
jgi:ribA/ribD-fused uncharacterized protein